VSRQRFVDEAEITGGLEHPGVVPVYGLGTYGGERPHYAMRFITGDSLKEAIDAFHQRRHRDSPSPPRGHILSDVIKKIS
jgi:eukaryotic-like serine/threonine-protein kinase